MPVVSLKQASPDAGLFHDADRSGKGGLSAVLASPAAHMCERYRFALTPCAGKAVCFGKDDNVVEKSRLKRYGLESFHCA